MSENHSSAREKVADVIEETDASADHSGQRDLEQRNAEIEKYLPLIERVVSRLMLRFPPLIEEQDMFAVGVLGLIDALERYQPGALSFSQYAEIRIRGAILDELRRADLFSRGLRRKARRYQEVVRQLQHRLGAQPSLQDIANSMQISIKEAEELRKQVQPMHFLEFDSMEVKEEEGIAKQERGVSGQNDPYIQTQRKQLRNKVRIALEQIPERERMILHLYYFEDLTMRGIGELLGLSESRICQIHRRACETLRQLLDLQQSDLSDLL